MKKLASLFLLASLVACGGGGGGANAESTGTPSTDSQIQFGNSTFGLAKFSQ